MAKIENKKLYLTEKERPEWWKPEEYVQIVTNNEDMFFIWHKQNAKKGYIQIDEYYTLTTEMIQRKWTVKVHSPDCICLIGEALDTLREKINKSNDKLEDEEEFILSIDLRKRENRTKANFIICYQDLLARLLEGKISVARFKAATEVLEVLIREHELFEPDIKPQITSIEELKQKLLQKAQEPNANVIDLIRSIKSLDEDGNMKVKERQLDDIIIETEETEKEEEIEIDF